MWLTDNIGKLLITGKKTSTAEFMIDFLVNDFTKIDAMKAYQQRIMVFT